MMRDVGIVKSYLAVFFFWYAVLIMYGNGANGVTLLFDALINSILIILLGTFLGAMIVYSYTWMEKESVRTLHKPGNFRGMVTDTGIFPCIKEPPAGYDRNLTELFLNDRLNTWFVDYEAKNPIHAKLFRVVAGIYDAHNDVPASHIPGGHSGASLRQHCENVLTEMLQSSSKWRYTGHWGKSGKLLKKPDDPKWKYEDTLAKSPILPLLAYVHDIGKIECYVEIDGKIKEVKLNHDTSGKRILIRMHEYWDLPDDEREILAMATSYYHHVGSLPLRCKDPVRAATELLIYIDITTGQKEGRGVDIYEDYGMGDQNLEFSEEVPTEEDERSLGIKLGFIPSDAAQGEDGQPIVDTQIIDDEALPAVNRVKPDNHAKAAWLYDIFISVLNEPYRINNNVADKRIGFKRDGLVYVQDLAWRKIAAERVDNNSLSVDKPGQLSEASQLIIEELKNRGALFDNFNGKQYGIKNALFKVETYVPAFKGSKGGKTVANKWDYTLIFKSDVNGGLDSLADSPGEIEIISNSWEKTEKEIVAEEIQAIIEKEAEVVSKSKSREIFNKQIEQFRKDEFSDIAFTIVPSGDKTYQCIRLDTLKMSHPEVDWENEPGRPLTDTDGNKMLCLLME
jgi:hypothetical protein